MNYLLIFSTIFLSWSAIHILASERERRVKELEAHLAQAAAAQRAAAEAPIVVS